MQEHETIQGYLDAVTAQIRWKRARPVLAQELGQHLEDQRDAFLQEGKPPKEAERLAVADMGDPVEVGAELDRVHRPRPQWGLLGLTLMLSCAGAALRVSLTAGWQFDSVKPAQTLLALVLGTAALLGMYFLDVSRLARHARAISTAVLAAGILSLFLSPYKNGVPYYTRCIVLLFPAAYAFWLYSLRQKGWIGVFLAILGGALFMLPCLLAPYIQAALLLLAVGFVLLLYASWQNWFGVSRKLSMASVLTLAFGLLALFASAVSRGFGAARLRVAFHPELDPLGTGFQGCQVREVLESARWFGEGGLDTGNLPFVCFLPNAASDMLPASMVYQLGWLPYLLTLAVLVLLLGWLLVRGMRQKHQLGRFVVLAVVPALGIQMLSSVALNMGVVLFSAHLPFVVGNLHTVLDMALVGLTLSVFRGSSIAREAEASEPIRRKRLRIRIEFE